MEPDWSLDYCLACDRQTTGQLYCSQLCRLADLESSAPSSMYGSEPASPTQPTSLSTVTAPSSRRHQQRSIHPDPPRTTTTAAAAAAANSHDHAFTSSRGFFLPPPFDFSAYRRPSSPCRPRSGSSWAAYCSGLSVSAAPSRSPSSSSSANSPRVLTPTSSHLSFETGMTAGVAGACGLDDGIPFQTRCELREYTASFDQARELKRRMTTS